MTVSALRLGFADEPPLESDRGLKKHSDLGESCRYANNSGMIAEAGNLAAKPCIGS